MTKDELLQIKEYLEKISDIAHSSLVRQSVTDGHENAYKLIYEELNGKGSFKQ